MATSNDTAARQAKQLEALGDVASSAFNLTNIASNARSELRAIGFQESEIIRRTNELLFDTSRQAARISGEQRAAAGGAGLGPGGSGAEVARETQREQLLQRQLILKEADDALRISRFRKRQIRKARKKGTIQAGTELLVDILKLAAVS